MRIPTRREFLKTAAGVDAQKELRLMVSNSSYDTDGSCNPKEGDGLSFVQRHLNYLIKHPYVSPTAYISNLRIMTRVGR